MTSDAAFLAAGFALGAACAWAVQHFRFAASRGGSPGVIEALQAKLAEQQQQNAAWEARFAEVQASRARAEAQNQGQAEQMMALKAALAAEETRRQNLQTQLAEERARQASLDERLKTEFQNLANEILHTVTHRFTESNKENLGGILQPLRENIEAFRKRIEEGRTHDADARGRLFQELDHLRQLNTRLTEEAGNLARALRGNNKTAGNWGEMILDTVLAHSGLTNGVEYQRQASNVNEDGRRIQPDTILFYPRQEGVLIVDSKVSLKDYTDFCNAEEKAAQELSAAAHVASIKAHICGLSGKKYQTGEKWVTPDFILLFLPVDGALALALNKDPGLYQFAFDQGIILITPSTLLTTLKLVRSLWQQDRQTRNAEEIAERGGKLFDKFVTFYRSLEEIEKGFQATGTAFTDAKKQLRDGPGSLYRQVEMLRELGVKTTKALPEASPAE